MDFKMVLRSYAKINLSLLVNKKTKTGIHEIQTLYCLIDLYDKISIKKIKSNKDHINFKGPYSNKISKSNNSITKLLILLRDLKLIKNYYSINIIKKIPVFAGLGGGSSNAAYVTRYLLKDKINKRLLKILENNLATNINYAAISFGGRNSNDSNFVRRSFLSLFDNKTKGGNTFLN